MTAQRPRHALIDSRPELSHNTQTKIEPQKKNTKEKHKTNGQNVNSKTKNYDNTQSLSSMWLCMHVCNKIVLNVKMGADR